MREGSPQLCSGRDVSVTSLWLPREEPDWWTPRGRGAEPLMGVGVPTVSGRVAGDP